MIALLFSLLLMIPMSISFPDPKINQQQTAENSGSSPSQVTRQTVTRASSPSSCPGGYIDELAMCPGSLSCVSDGNCSALQICCENMCGTKTCVHPWRSEVNDIGESRCADKCTGQGKLCKIVDGLSTCQCNDLCGPPTTNEDFVCADNGMTYFTSCFMDMEACRTGKDISTTTCNSIPTPNTILVTSANNNNYMNTGDDDSSSLVIPPMVISVPSIVRVKEHKSVTFTCEVTGSPKPAIFWKRKEETNFMKPGDDNGRIFITESLGQLLIRNAEFQDSGEYLCIAANRGGAVWVKFRLSVEALNRPNHQRRSSQVVCQTYPSEQAVRCSSEEVQRRIRRLWIYDRRQKTCVKSFFRDCSAITNKFPTFTACANSCMDLCKFPLKQGSCRSFVQRIYYNSETGNCEPFVYSGCQGNSNNFPDVDTCKARCPSVPITDSDRPPRLISPSDGPIDPVCDTCNMHLPQAYCRSDFVLTGTVSHVRLEVGEDESSTAMYNHRYVQVDLISVLKDNSELNLLKLLLQQTPSLQIRLDTEDTCPCPNMKTVLKVDNAAPENAVLSSVSTRRSGKSATHRYNTKIILVGKVVNGLPVLDSSGYVARDNKRDLDRIKSLSESANICTVIEIFQERFS